MKKKIDNNFSDYIEGVKLYRDDFDEIINRCKSKSIILEIMDEDNSYDSIAELITNKGTNLSKLEFKGRIDGDKSFHAITISFQRGTTYLSFIGDPELISFGHEIFYFIKKRVVWHYKLFDPWLFGFIAFIPLVWREIFHDVSLKNLMIIFSGFLLLLFLLSVYNRKFNFNLSLLRRHEVGFLKRNKDTILLSIISSIIGALILFLIQLISHKQ